MARNSSDALSIYTPDLLKGKVCLVTGGSRGGMLKDIALQYGRLGAKAIVLMSRNKEKNQAVADQINQELAEMQGKTPGSVVIAHSLPGDVSKLDDCKRVVSSVVQQFGQVDVLVNGAAGNFMATADKLSPNGMRRVLEIDAIGTFLMSQQVFNQSMKARRTGTIINISTTLHYNGSFGFIHANAAKAGIDAMTKTLAVEWGPYGVTVNGIVPGPIEGTEGFSRLTLANLNDKKKTNEAFSKDQKGSSKDSGINATGDSANPFKMYMPVGRFGHVNDISNAAVFLASPAASFITGTDILVDGGQWLTAPNMAFASPQFVKIWSRAKL